MKILFVLDELPYPPRNGVTIPTFNWITGLASQFNVSLLFVKNDKEQINHQQLGENARYVENLWVIERYRTSTFRRIRDELLMKMPYGFGWSCDTIRLQDVLYRQSFDAVWGSPLTVTETVKSVSDMLGPSPIYIAGIHDSLTNVYRSMRKCFFLNGLDIKTRASYVLLWLRSWLMQHIEVEILQKYDLVLVQTEIEKMWLKKISACKLYNKTMVVSNGVNAVLFNLPIEHKGNHLLFFATLSGIYGSVLSWIIKKVWPIISNSCKDVRLCVVGRYAPPKLRQEMATDYRITYTEYVPEICDVYKDKAISIAPVFKGYGLINKVVESMAAGLPVVGDSGSFNGIPNFKNGHQGIIANDAESMAAEILDLIDSPGK